MDIKDSILNIPYGEIKEYVDTRIQFNELISNKKYRTILDEITDRLNGKQDTLKAGKNITISGNTISAKGYVFNESNTSFSQGIGTTTRNTCEHAEGKYNKSNIVPVFVDLGLSVNWATSNIGATCEDTAESWYGDYYAWGETETKSNYSWNTYKFGTSSPFSKYDTDGKLVLEAADDVVTSIYGFNYRIPTKAEIEELIALPNEWVTDYNGISGLNGRVFTGTNGNTLFIPAAGFFDGSTNSNAGSDCGLWSSSLYSTHHNIARSLYFSSGIIGVGDSYRYYGFSVRCVSRIASHTTSEYPLHTQHSIGVGTSEQHRQNAVEVMNDGSVYIKDVDLYDGTNPQDSYSLQQVIQKLIEDRLVISAHINKLTNQVDDLLHTLYAPKMKFIDLGISVNWAQYNAGVDPEDLSTAESWYGDFYAWGETETKTDYSWNTYKFGTSSPFSKYDTDGKTKLDSSDDLYKNKYYKYFGNQYRMPTKAELEELIALPNKWITDFKGITGLNGRIFAKTQAELDGTFNDDTMLFIPAAGYFDGSTHSSAGSSCGLWSSSIYSDSPYDARYLYFSSDGVDVGSLDRYYGFSVRCVSDK